MAAAAAAAGSGAAGGGPHGGQGPGPAQRKHLSSGEAAGLASRAETRQVRPQAGAGGVEGPRAGRQR